MRKLLFMLPLLLLSIGLVGAFSDCQHVEEHFLQVVSNNNAVLLESSYTSACSFYEVYATTFGTAAHTKLDCGQDLYSYVHNGNTQVIIAQQSDDTCSISKYTQ